MSTRTNTGDGGSNTNDGGQGPLPNPTASHRELRATAGGTLAVGAGIWVQNWRAPAPVTEPTVHCTDRGQYVGESRGLGRGGRR